MKTNDSFAEFALPAMPDSARMARSASAVGTGPTRLLLTLLFTDIVGSTLLAERLGDGAWHRLLLQHRAAARNTVALFGGREIDSSGDGMFATFDAPVRAVQCAAHLCVRSQELGIQIRAGIHTGECEVEGSAVTGIAVHAAARIAALAEAGEVLVSNTVRDLVDGSALRFSAGAQHALKGMTGSRRLFALQWSDAGSAPDNTRTLPWSTSIEVTSGPSWASDPAFFVLAD